MLVQCVGQEPAFTFDLKDRVELLTFSPDGGMLGVDTGYNFVIFDTITGEIKGRLNTPGYSVNSAIFSADSSFLITGNNDGKVRWFDTKAFLIQKTFSVTKWSIYNLAISSDGKFLVVDAADGTIELWNTEKGERFGSLGSKGQRSQYVGLSPDNEFLATIDLDGRLDFFDLRNPRVVFSVQTSTSSPFVYCRDGAELILTRSDSVDLRSVESGDMLRSFRIPRDVVPISERAPGMGGLSHGQVVLSPDCALVAVNNWKTRTVTLLDASSLKIKQVVDDSKSDGSSFVMRFSPDSRFITTGSTTGKVKLWRVK